MRTLACSLTLLCLIVSAQAQSSANCPAAPSALKPTAANIFNAQQEQDLGDAYAEIEDAHLRFVNDPAATAYLDRIGQRLLAVLPANNFRFRYKIVDSWQVNAWSIAGGHVYVTRKLITAATNEDEIAGVMAHEFGHIFIHQQAIETTADLKYALNVTSVGDRADIFDKIQRLRDAENDWRWRRPRQKDEEIADAIAVYVLVKAGYMPGAYADFWNQVAQTKGKSGSVMGDIFRTTRPSEQRLYGILKNLSAIPAGCATATTASVPPEFVTWRERVTADPTDLAPADLEDKGIQLNPPLRSDFTRLQFSPDSKYLLAQDSASIFVLGRSPLRLLFQIDAENADPASFSPDSTRVSFSSPSMRVQEWDLTSRQLLGAHDVLTYQPCLLHLLSPDGHVMACVSNTSRTKPQLGLTLWDVNSGNVILQEDEAFDLSSLNVNFGFGFSYSNNYSWWVSNKLHWPLVRWAFTPDSKRLMVNHEPSTLVYDLDQLFEGPGLHEVKAHPELVAEERPLKNHLNGFLVEVLDKHTGAYLRGVVADVSHGGWWRSATHLRTAAFGDFALIEGRFDSTIVYRFSTGARLGEVFGEIVAQDAASGMFCVSNSDNDLVVYDAATVRELRHFTFATRVRFAQFLPARKQLLVLTADQKLHTISIDDLHAGSVPATTGAGSH